MTTHTDGTEPGQTLRIPHDVSDISERVLNSGERIPVEKDGHTVAVLVPTSDIAALEALEERLDLLDALDALADYRVHGGVEWTELKAELGI